MLPVNLFRYGIPKVVSQRRRDAKHTTQKRILISSCNTFAS